MNSKDLINWVTANLPVIMAAGGGGSIVYAISTYVKHLPRTWPLTLKDIYFCFVDGSQDLVSQRNLPPPPQQTVVLPPGYTYKSDALQVAHTDPTTSSAIAPTQPK